VYLDALMVKVRDEGHIQNKAIYVVLGVNLRGRRKCWGCGWRSHGRLHSSLSPETPAFKLRELR